MSQPKNKLIMNKLFVSMKKKEKSKPKVRVNRSTCSAANFYIYTRSPHNTVGRIHDGMVFTFKQSLLFSTHHVQLKVTAKLFQMLREIKHTCSKENDTLITVNYVTKLLLIKFLIIN